MSTKHNNLFEQITHWQNLERAHANTLRGRLRYQTAALHFNQNRTHNLTALRQRLLTGSYTTQGYYQFTVYEPKERLVWAPKYQDKIVQHAINNVLKDIYRPCFIRDSYACIEGRGTHAAVERISANLRQAGYWWGDASYIVKLDIRKFFYSIDRTVLKSLLRKKIACERTLNLLDHIIDSSPDGAGLPLGNLTSQLLANIYLNELDQYAKRTLGARFYVRYADDITAIAPSKREATALLCAVRRFLSDRLHLDLHPEKSEIFPLRQGVNTIGFKLHPTHRLLRTTCKRRIKRKLRAMPALVRSGRLTHEQANQLLGSWHGHARHGCSANFVSTLIARHAFLTLNSSADPLRINPSHPAMSYVHQLH